MSAQKRAFDLRILGAAYRNRTDDLRITSVFPCVARGFKACASFMFAGCCWWRSLVVDGCSGHLGGTLVMRGPSARCRGAVVPDLFLIRDYQHGLSPA